MSISDLPKQPLVIDLTQTDEEVFSQNKVNKTLSPPQTPHISTTKKKTRTNPKNHVYANFDAVVSHRAAQQFNDKRKPEVSKGKKKTKHKKDQIRTSSESAAKVNKIKKPLSAGNRKASEPTFVVSNSRLTEVEGSNANIDRYTEYYVFDLMLFSDVVVNAVCCY